MNEWKPQLQEQTDTIKLKNKKIKIKKTTTNKPNLQSVESRSIFKAKLSFSKGTSSNRHYECHRAGHFHLHSSSGVSAGSCYYLGSGAADKEVTKGAPSAPYTTSIPDSERKSGKGNLKKTPTSYKVCDADRTERQLLLLAERNSCPPRSATCQPTAAPIPSYSISHPNPAALRWGCTAAAGWSCGSASLRSALLPLPFTRLIILINLLTRAGRPYLWEKTEGFHTVSCSARHLKIGLWTRTITESFTNGTKV